MSEWEKVTTKPRSPYRAMETRGLGGSRVAWKCTDCGHGGEAKLYEDALRHFRSHRHRLH